VDAQSISPYQLLTLIASIISSSAVVLSLILVYRQTRIFARQTEYVARSVSANVSESLNDQSHEISRLFVQYPNLRPYFYDGQDIEDTHSDFPRAEAIAELILDIFWSMSTTAQRFMDSGTRLAMENNEKLWQSYVGESFAQSPLLVKTLMKRRNWYGQALVEQMNESLKYHATLLEQANTQPQ
jgi:hypothetical protein